MRLPADWSRTAAKARIFKAMGHPARLSIMVVEVLGPGCADCKRLFSLVEQAVKDLSLQARLGKVADIGAIAGYGVMRTPAVVVDGVVKVSGRVPRLEETKAILQGVK